ncbi:MAG: ribosomal-protein-alanine acetyltransferase, partial [Gemmobacter sp.]
HARCFTSPPPWSEAAFAAALADPNGFLCGEGAGFALGRVTLDEAELLTLAVAPEARRRHLSLEWRVDDMAPIAADADALRQVLLNLLLNAC